MSNKSKIRVCQELLARNGWKMTTKRVTTERTEIKARHPGGAMALVVLFRESFGHRNLRYHVLCELDNGEVCWYETKIQGFRIFAETQNLPQHHRQQTAPDCRCGKVCFPCEDYANDVVLQSKIHRVFAGNSRRRERNVYLCPDDARVWHVTSQDEPDEERAETGS